MQSVRSPTSELLDDELGELFGDPEAGGIDSSSIYCSHANVICELSPVCGNRVSGRLVTTMLWDEGDGQDVWNKTTCGVRLVINQQMIFTF